MTRLIQQIVTHWPYIAGSVGAITAIAAFILTILRIKQLTLSIKDLESKLQEREKQVAIPSLAEIKEITNEIEKYRQQQSELLKKTLYLSEKKAQYLTKGTDQIIHEMKDLHETLARIRSRLHRLDRTLEEIRNI